MRVDEGDHQVERLVVLALEELDGRVHGRLVHVMRQFSLARGLVQHLEAGDAVAGIGVRHVPLAGIAGVVAGGAEHLARKGHGGINRHRVAVHLDLMRRAAGVQRRARGTAQRKGAVGLGEIHPVGGEGVHVRRLQPGIARGAGRGDLLLVGGDEEHIGTFGGLRRLPARRQRQEAQDAYPRLQET